MNKAGAVFFTSVINKGPYFERCGSCSIRKLQNLSVEIAIPEDAESVRLENAV